VKYLLFISFIFLCVSEVSFAKDSVSNKNIRLREIPVGLWQAKRVPVNFKGVMVTPTSEAESFTFRLRVHEAGVVWGELKAKDDYRCVGVLDQSFIDSLGLKPFDHCLNIDDFYFSLVNENEIRVKNSDNVSITLKKIKPKVFRKRQLPGAWQSVDNTGDEKIIFDIDHQLSVVAKGDIDLGGATFISDDAGMYLLINEWGEIISSQLNIYQEKSYASLGMKSF